MLGSLAGPEIFVYLVCPLAGLSEDVEEQAIWTPEGGQGVAPAKVVPDAPDGVLAARIRRQPKVFVLRTVFAQLVDVNLQLLLFSAVCGAKVQLLVLRRRLADTDPDSCQHCCAETELCGTYGGA